MRFSFTHSLIHYTLMEHFCVDAEDKMSETHCPEEIPKITGDIGMKG